jgi:predicted nucleotidyltransferase
VLLNTGDPRLDRIVDAVVARANQTIRPERVWLFGSQAKGTAGRASDVDAAFEFTFETVWKLLEHLAESEGLSADSPRRALMAGYKLGVLEDSPCGSTCSPTATRRPTSIITRAPSASSSPSRRVTGEPSGAPSRRRAPS